MKSLQLRRCRQITEPRKYCLMRVIVFFSLACVFSFFFFVSHRLEIWVNSLQRSCKLHKEFRKKYNNYLECYINSYKGHANCTTKNLRYLLISSHFPNIKLSFILMAPIVATPISESSDITDFVVTKGNGVKGLSEMGLKTIPRQYIQPVERKDQCEQHHDS